MHVHGNAVCILPVCMCRIVVVNKYEVAVI